MMRRKGRWRWWRVVGILLLVEGVQRWEKGFSISSIVDGRLSGSRD